MHRASSADVHFNLILADFDAVRELRLQLSYLVPLLAKLTLTTGGVSLLREDATDDIDPLREITRICEVFLGDHLVRGDTVQ